MGVSAGYGAKVLCSLTDGSYQEVGHLNSASTKVVVDQLDTTNFTSSGGDKEEIGGLRSIEFGNLAGDYDPADTNQTMIRDACFNRTMVFLKVLPDGGNGVSVQCTIADYEVKSTVAGKVEFSFTPKSSGLPTLITD